MSETSGKSPEKHELQQLIDRSPPLKNAVMSIVRNALHEHAGNYLAGLSKIGDDIVELIERREEPPPDTIEAFLVKEFTKAMAN